MLNCHAKTSVLINGKTTLFRYASWIEGDATMTGSKLVWDVCCLLQYLLPSTSRGVHGSDGLDEKYAHT
jgi:hypothetical protein